MGANGGGAAPKDVTTALWFYAGLEGDGEIEIENEEDMLVCPKW